MSSPPSEAISGPAADGAVSTLSIRAVNPLEVPGWDAAIAAFPGATFFHTRAWAAVLHASYGFAPRYLLASAGDPALAANPKPLSPSSGLSRPSLPPASPSALLGVLPLMEVRSWLTGRRGVSLPFTDTCAPLAIEDAISHHLFRAAVDRGRGERWRYCEVRGGRTALRAPASVTFYGHSVDLRPGVHELWAALGASVCRAVRKAETNRVQFEFATSPDALGAFYELLCQSRRRHGLPPQPRRFFDQIHQHVLAPGFGTVVLARYNDQPIAGAVFFEFGRTALYKFGASDERFLNLRPNNLVMWRAIERYTQRGFETLDLGRTSLANEGLRRFKQHWNAEEHLIEYVRYNCRRDRFESSRDAAAGWHSLVFRHLPLRLSRLIGALTYRHAA